MSVSEVLSVLIGCILVNNYILSNFFGFEGIRDSKKCAKYNWEVALFITVSLLIATTVCFPLDKYLLSTYAPWAKTITYVIIVFFSVLLTNKVLMSKIEKDTKWENTVVALNSVVLGTLLLNGANGYGWILSYVAVIGTGIGYFLVAMIIAGVKGRINMKFVPESFRGAPIYLAALAICSMAIFAF